MGVDLRLKVQYVIYLLVNQYIMKKVIKNCTAQKMKLSITDLVSFTREIHDGKFRFMQCRDKEMKVI